MLEDSTRARARGASCQPLDSGVARFAPTRAQARDETRHPNPEMVSQLRIAHARGDEPPLQISVNPCTWPHAQGQYSAISTALKKGKACITPARARQYWTDIVQKSAPSYCPAHVRVMPDIRVCRYLQRLLPRARAGVIASNFVTALLLCIAPRVCGRDLKTRNIGVTSFGTAPRVRA